jgi:hypothetical protein
MKFVRIHLQCRFSERSHTIYAIEMQTPGVKAKALPFDFSKVNDPEQWASFRNEVESLEVGVLGKFTAIFVI